MKQQVFCSLLVLGLAVALSPSASAAGNNNPPPAGAILDLNGLPVNHGAAIQQSVNFVANLANTDVTFAFREDPAFISFSNVSLTDLTHPGGNLILNGNFASGSGHNATFWTYDNVFGASASGVVSTSCGGGLATCWYDGSVQAYDAIDQMVATAIGDTYRLSFFYSDNDGLSTFQRLSTNGDTTDSGGNGIDILAYAQAGLPQPGGATPEPSSIALLGTGLLGVAGAVRRRVTARV